MENAVIYARYSSASQREESIEQQVRICRKYASDHNLNVVAVYDDRAMTGTVDKRPGFQRMIRDSKNRGWQYVIVYALDRFARDRYDSANYKHQLRANGVRVLSATEQIPDDPSGIIMESLLEGMAEYYSKELARKVNRGLEDNARKCMVTGVLPLGYRKGPDSKYEIDPAGAAIVKEAFARVKAREQITSIIDDFNARGLRTRVGKPWNKNSMDKLLHNERYTGVYIFRDIRIENGIPAIVSRPDFDAVQNYLYTKQNARRDKTGATPQRRRQDTGVYLLTGKLYCGHCQEPMVGISGHSRNGTSHYYYGCRGHHNNTGCRKKNIRRDFIEEILARSLRQNILSDSVIEALADSVIASQKSDDAVLELESLRNLLSETKRSIANLMKAIEAGIFTATTRDRMLELEAQKENLEHRIQTAEALCRDLPTRSQIVVALQMFREGDIKDKDYQASLLDTFLRKAYLYDDHIDVVFTISGDTFPTSIPLTADDLSASLDSLDDKNVRISGTSLHHQTLYEHAIISFHAYYAYRTLIETAQA